MKCLDAFCTKTQPRAPRPPLITSPTSFLGLVGQHHPQRPGQFGQDGGRRDGLPRLVLLDDLRLLVDRLGQLGLRHLFGQTGGHDAFLQVGRDAKTSGERNGGMRSERVRRVVTGARAGRDPLPLVDRRPMRHARKSKGGERAPLCFHEGGAATVLLVHAATSLRPSGGPGSSKRSLHSRAVRIVLSIPMAIPSPFLLFSSHRSCDSSSVSRSSLAASFVAPAAPCALFAPPCFFTASTWPARKAAWRA